MTRTDKELLSWLTTVPASDSNWKSALAEADRNVCLQALDKLAGRPGSKSAVKSIDARIRTLDRAAAAIDVHSEVVSASNTPVVAQSEDQLRGQQLTEQWDRACAGMVEILKFGAMMLELRAILIPRAESKHSGSGRYAKGEGLKAWLGEFAPTVSRTTAERYMALAEELQDHFKLGKKASLSLLLSSPDEELGDKLARKKSDVLEFVQGKSQRQLMLALGSGKPKQPKGGNVLLGQWLKENYPDLAGTAQGDLSPEIVAEFEAWRDSREKEQQENPEQFMAVTIWTPLIKKLAHEACVERSWAHLPDAMLRELKELIVEVNQLLPRK